MLDLNAIFDVDEPVPTRQPQPTTPHDLPAEWWLVWDERAAIKEYDGGLDRELAEAQALTEVIRLMSAERNSKAGLDICNI